MEVVKAFVEQGGQQVQAHLVAKTNRNQLCFGNRLETIIASLGPRNPALPVGTSFIAAPLPGMYFLPVLDGRNIMALHA